MPPETLGQRQRRFARLLPRLLDAAYQMGYELTLGEAWRPEWVALEYQRRGTGVYPSFHTSRCAIDLNVFKGGVWLKSGAQYEDLGKFWESIGGVWGERFKNKDGAHFSLGEGKAT